MNQYMWSRSSLFDSNTGLGWVTVVSISCEETRTKRLPECVDDPPSDGDTAQKVANTRTAFFSSPRAWAEPSQQTHKLDLVEMFLKRS